MIECKNINKKYKKKTALSDVSFTINKGVYGLIGENGAGKSTLMKILIGQESVTEGKIEIDGVTPSIGKLKIGYLPQKFDFFHNLTVYEGLEYMGILKEIDSAKLHSQVEYWLEQVNLTNESHKKISLLSGGMKQRLGIAQAFLGEPDYVLLDEPTVGLDPKERLAFRNMVNEIGSEKAILISTHIIDDVQATCENILVLHKGTLLFGDTTQNFMENINQNVYTLRIPRNALQYYSSKLNIISIQLLGEELEVRFLENDDLDLMEKSTLETCNLEDAYFLATNMYYRKGTII